MRALEDGWLEPPQEEPDDHGSSLLLTSKMWKNIFQQRLFSASKLILIFFKREKLRRRF
jgi:hypothetical protein